MPEKLDAITRWAGRPGIKNFCLREVCVSLRFKYLI